MAEQDEHQYVASSRGAVYTALMDGWKDPSFIVKILGCVVFLVILAALIVPPYVPGQLGPYRYAHPGVVAVVLYLFFLKVLPPPPRATARTRRRFIRTLNKPELLKAGLDSRIVMETKIAGDHTLEITVDDGWLSKSYENRLLDAHNLWWLWAISYAPGDGWDDALIRLVDSKGREVGGSKPEAGSLIWVQRS